MHDILLLLCSSDEKLHYVCNSIIHMYIMYTIPIVRYDVRRMQYWLSRTRILFPRFGSILLGNTRGSDWFFSSMCVLSNNPASHSLLRPHSVYIMLFPFTSAGFPIIVAFNSAFWYSYILHILTNDSVIRLVRRSILRLIRILYIVVYYAIFTIHTFAVTID